jgi:DNA modification methylase
VPLRKGSVACVVTSPPYNVGVEYDVACDALGWDDYRAMAKGAAKEIERVLIPGGRAWLNVTPVVPIEPLPPGWHSARCPKERLSLLDIWSDAVGTSGLKLWDIVCWPTMGRGPGTAWGSWASPAAPNLRGQWEAILVFYKGAWARQTPSAWKNWKDADEGWTALVSNCWKMQPEANRSHPAPFPLELPARAIRLSTWPGEVVLDPFSGSGSTVRAAYGLGRVGIGCDLSQSYLSKARGRGQQGRLIA